MLYRVYRGTDPAARVILARSQIAGRQLIGLKWDRPLQILDFTGFGLKPLSELISDGRAEDIFLSDASQYGRLPVRTHPAVGRLVSLNLSRRGGVSLDVSAAQ